MKFQVELFVLLTELYLILKVSLAIMPEIDVSNCGLKGIDYFFGAKYIRVKYSTQ